MGRFSQAMPWAINSGAVGAPEAGSPLRNSPETRENMNFRGQSERRLARITRIEKHPCHPRNPWLLPPIPDSPLSSGFAASDAPPAASECLLKDALRLPTMTALARFQSGTAFSGNSSLEPSRKSARFPIFCSQNISLNFAPRVRSCENLCLDGVMQKPNTPTSQHNNTLPFPSPHGAPRGPRWGSEPATAPAPGAVEPPAGGRKRGRSPIYSDKVIEMICDPSAGSGFRSAAAESVGMSSSSLSCWKHDHPEIKQKLLQARQQGRIHHLELVAKFAEGNNALRLPAATWMAERLFPATTRRRCASSCLSDLEEQRDRNEERAVGNEIWAETLAAQRAEARQAEAAKQAAASESDSHNVQNRESRLHRGGEAIIQGGRALRRFDPSSL